MNREREKHQDRATAVGSGGGVRVLLIVPSARGGWGAGAVPPPGIKSSQWQKDNKREGGRASCLFSLQPRRHS